MKMLPTAFWLCTLSIGGSIACAAGQDGPVKVTIEEDNTVASERTLPLDPIIRVAYEYVGNMSFGVNAEGKRLTCAPGSAISTFKIDGRVVMPAGNFPAQPLPVDPKKKKRIGMQTSWQAGDIKITMILEIVPGKPFEKNAVGPQKRRMDTLLIKYVLENAGTKSHEVGAGVFIDTMCGNNDGAIFASPTTHPGKLLDGVVLAEQNVPEFLEMLEIPNLQNPGFKGIFTFKMGKGMEGPNKIVLTSMQAGLGNWNVRAIPAMGDSATAFFWDPREIKAQGKREVAFALGMGIACNPENEGKVSIDFGGNFEPHKEFTVTAYVDDPIEGQSLTLELPKGMVRTEGKDTQSVPPPADGGQSVVLWKGRVQELGTYPVRIRSNNGVTYTRTIAITRPDGD